MAPSRGVSMTALAHRKGFNNVGHHSTWKWAETLKVKAREGAWRNCVMQNKKRGGGFKKKSQSPGKQRAPK